MTAQILVSGKIITYFAPFRKPFREKEQAPEAPVIKSPQNAECLCKINTGGRRGSNGRKISPQGGRLCYSNKKLAARTMSNSRRRKLSPQVGRLCRRAVSKTNAAETSRSSDETNTGGRRMAPARNKSLFDFYFSLSCSRPICKPEDRFLPETYFFKRRVSSVSLSNMWIWLISIPRSMT